MNDFEGTFIDLCREAESNLSLTKSGIGHLRTSDNDLEHVIEHGHEP